MPSATEHSNLPLPDAIQQQQSAAVLADVRGAIASRGGWLPFDEYLQRVLYSPGLGYYSAGAAKLGAAGDFTTAPEISSLFGHCIARQCAALLPALGPEAAILELGAGTGRLAATLLARLAELDALPARYLILEVSADLRARQQQLLAALPPALRARVTWIDALPTGPLHAVILANEVADALPFQRFAVDVDGVSAQGVSVAADGSLCWAARPADAALRREYQRIQADLAAPLAPGYSSEFCPMLDGWVAGLAATLAAGVVLLFDYGLGRRELYHPTRSSGTLRCHYRHRAHDDPFLYPGLQDITAWVDFTRVAEAAVEAGLEVVGYCTQAAFLLGAGIDAELALAEDPVQHARLVTQARQLLLPGEMGETFKAIALRRHCEVPLQGFAVQDLRRLL
jgi:SAM-dependent MidA family methyltransferase